jgi:hypothetical protein
MTSLGRVFVCMVAAAAGGGLSLLAVAIFGPLLFPLSLTDSGGPENKLFVVAVISFLVFSVVSGGLCWKVTERRVKN